MLRYFMDKNPGFWGVLGGSAILLLCYSAIVLFCYCAIVLSCYCALALLCSYDALDDDALELELAPEELTKAETLILWI